MLTLQGSTNYAAIKNSDVVIVTAGFQRRPGMSRDDLVNKNAGIIQQVGKAIKNIVQKLLQFVLQILLMPWLVFCKKQED